MGSRGPLPQSAHLRALKGGSEEPRTAADETPAGRPRRPAFLAGEARKEWERIVPELERQRLLARTDRALLVLWCRTWARWLELDEQLGEAYVTQGAKSEIMNPLFRAWRDAGALLSQLSRQLGLDPTSRLRMPAPPAKPEAESPLDRMRREGRNAGPAA